jgi:hypothetical protein
MPACRFRLPFARCTTTMRRTRSFDRPATDLVSTAAPMPRDTTRAPNNDSRRGRARGGFAAPPQTSYRNSTHVHASPQDAAPSLDDPEQPSDEHVFQASNGSGRVSHVSRGSGRGSQKSVGSRTSPLSDATVVDTPVPARYLKHDHSGLPLVHDFEAFSEEG